MKIANDRPPVVLAISGHDPTGAAGVQADIEAVAECGARCATLITATTAQSTAAFGAVFPQPVTELRRAADFLLADMSFSACKIGLIGSPAIAELIAGLLSGIGPLPVVVDPVLRAGTGTPVADPRTIEVYQRQLLRLSTVVTPNCGEARVLGGSENAEEAAGRILAMGPAHVLVTGADEPTPRVVNILYSAGGGAVRHEFDRIPGRFHGSGCTLSAALAAFLARGLDVPDAVRLAQEYTHGALRRGYALGRGQLHPDRNAAPES